MTELRQVMWTQMLGFLDLHRRQITGRRSQAIWSWNLVSVSLAHFAGGISREDRPRQPELQVSFRCLHENHESEISELRIWLDVRQQQLL